MNKSLFSDFQLSLGNPHTWPFEFFWHRRRWDYLICLNIKLFVFWMILRNPINRAKYLVNATLHTPNAWKVVHKGVAVKKLLYSWWNFHPHLYRSWSRLARASLELSENHLDELGHQVWVAETIVATEYGQDGGWGGVLTCIEIDQGWHEPVQSYWMHQDDFIQLLKAWLDARIDVENTVNQENFRCFCGWL